MICAIFVLNVELKVVLNCCEAGRKNKRLFWEGLDFIEWEMIRVEMRESSFNFHSIKAVRSVPAN